MAIILLVGHLNNAVIQVGALAICMNFNGWEGILFIGVNAAVGVRVSNELGLKHPRAAKYSVYVTVLQCLLIGLLCMVAVIIARDHFAIIFTSSEEMQRAVADLAYLLGVTMVLNSVQPVISGVAIGGGWQSLVAYINLGCYYLFGLPLGFVLGYIADLGVMGLWAGMIAGIALQTLLLLLVLYRTNWNKEIWSALAKAFHDGSDELQLFALNQKAFMAKQSGRTLFEYLTGIFQELDHRDKVVMKDPDDVEAYQKSIERLRVHIFLAGLDNVYEQIRGEILKKESIPTLEDCYALIQREAVS
ncbi:Multi antimicrobial extrusion protein [Corchorus capsularis]|uniref:Multi antimicrobial extrusion protein n=1 Tax=Corchorus capsularis TaxID=210143 RepID=A0A1R3JI98_COCAP|nr:Multi antimicrobial extrusion protein [Corchorus capsularis]